MDYCSGNYIYLVAGRFSKNKINTGVWIVPEFSRSLAFVIGINNYGNGISPLQTAVNDAKKLVEILREKHDYKVWVCLDELATLKNLNTLLEETLPKEVTENDRLLFYFAGHGIALNGDDGPQGYLIPQDVKVGDTTTYLPMAQVHECLSQLQCRHFLGILDCCFAGAFRWSSTRDLLSIPEVIHQERYERFITDPAWQVITSAAYDQKALDAFNVNTERGQIGQHSPFATALFEALEGQADIYPPASNGKPSGDGVITATELYLYLRNVVEPATQGYRYRQTPGIWPLDRHDKGEYIFLTPGHRLNLPPAPPLDESQIPYRGLKSYEPEHSDLFFGRAALIEQLYNAVCERPLTVVLGASGSGKSSLVKGGLISRLRLFQGEQRWEILTPMSPGEYPFKNLNLVLKQLNGGAGDRNIVETISTWCKEHPDIKLLLVVDQSEELITQVEYYQEGERFLSLLAEALKTCPNQLRILLTLRSDFEPQLKNTALEPYWKAARFWVPAMTREELREVIEEPASLQVMYFEPHRLVDQLIDEVAQMPGALPLLSFALEQLYLKVSRRYSEARKVGDIVERAITLEDYEEVGGVTGSLTQRADEVYDKLVQQDLAYAQTIRHVMLRMVSVEGGFARRQVRLLELEYPTKPDNERVKKVLKEFLEARLLVTGKDSADQPYVEPAHDVLITAWGMLVKWIKDERQTLLLQRRLTFAAENWQLQQSLEFEELNSFKKGINYFNREDYLRTQTTSNFLWSNDPYLEGLKQVLNSGNNNWLNKNETMFVQRSLQQRLKNRLLIALERIPIALGTIVLSVHFIFWISIVFIKFLGIILLVLSLSMFKSLFRQ